MIPVKAALADREKNHKSLVSGGGSGGHGGILAMKFIRGPIQVKKWLYFHKLAQEKIGELDFYPGCPELPSYPELAEVAMNCPELQ